LTSAVSTSVSSRTRVAATGLIIIPSKPSPHVVGTNNDAGDVLVQDYGASSLLFYANRQRVAYTRCQSLFADLLYSE